MTPQTQMQKTYTRSPLSKIKVDNLFRRMPIVSTLASASVPLHTGKPDSRGILLHNTIMVFLPVQPVFLLGAFQQWNQTAGWTSAFHAVEFTAMYGDATMVYKRADSNKGSKTAMCYAFTRWSLVPN